MDFSSIIRKRRSIRRFRPGGVVFKTIKEIVDAGRQAPSPGNSQPWRFLIISSEQDKGSIREFCEKTDPGRGTRSFGESENMTDLDFLTTCPFLILVFGDKEKPFWRESCWSAITMLVLKATDLGLGTLTYTPPRTMEINRLLSLPGRYRLAAIVPVGEPDEFPSAEDRPRMEVDEVMRRAEDVPRQDRSSLKDLDDEHRKATEFLRTQKMFQALTTESFEELCSLVTVKNYPKGGYVVRKGDAPEGFFIIVQGMIEVLSDDGQGNERIITFLGEAECFGEMSILSGEPVSADIRATGELTVVRIGKEEFLHIVEGSPQLNLFFTQLITRRLRKTNLQLVEESLMQGLTGRLTIISLPELIQALNISGKNGTLGLKGDNGQVAHVYVKEGQIIDVEMDGQHGAEIFYGLMRWAEGEFKFLSEEVDREVTIHIETMALLMEGMRQEDELTRTHTKEDVQPSDGTKNKMDDETKEIRKSDITDEQSSALDDALGGFG